MLLNWHNSPGISQIASLRARHRKIAIANTDVENSGCLNRQVPRTFTPLITEEERLNPAKEQYKEGKQKHPNPPCVLQLR